MTSGRDLNSLLSRVIIPGAKVLVGLAFALTISISYAQVFAYTHPAFVYGAAIVCFGLLTLPLWFRYFARPRSRLVSYYIVVLVVLLVAALGRFVVEALLASQTS